MKRRVTRILALFGALSLVVGTMVCQGATAELAREIVPLEREGVKLYLESFRARDAQEKDPILLVHGLTYSSHEFDVNYGDYSLLRFLVANGYEVWLLVMATRSRWRTASGRIRTTPPKTSRLLSDLFLPDAAGRRWMSSAGVGEPLPVDALPPSIRNWCAGWCFTLRSWRGWLTSKSRRLSMKTRGFMLPEIFR